MTDKETQLFESWIRDKKLTSTDLVQIIELCCTYGNIRPVSEYAKLHKLSYQGVIKTRNIIEILGVKCVVENNY
jgi:hypothetical protein